MVDKERFAKWSLIGLAMAGWIAWETFKPPLPTTEVCINGVTYLEFPRGVSVEYDPDGKVRRCGEPVVPYVLPPLSKP